MGNPPSPPVAPQPTGNDRVAPSSGDTPVLEEAENWSAKTKGLVRRAERSHRRIPGLRKIPLRAIGIILFIAFLNVVVWVAAAIVLVCVVPFYTHSVACQLVANEVEYQRYHPYVQSLPIEQVELRALVNINDLPL